MKPSDLFNLETNCWRTGTASYATPLIDCANYYSALHESICRARHSIFIIGWDIDSRIRLLHGEEEKRCEAPSCIIDLLAWKAHRNPDIQIYLLRWDSSFAFFSQRELWAREVWDEKTPDNVHVCLDDTIPMGGCQHQKVVVIDDEVAFSGGMDIAAMRWDTREHKIEEPEREDAEGRYGPLHDVQMVVAGDIVQSFSELCRWRWNRVAHCPAIEPQAERAVSTKRLPRAWPSEHRPVFEQVPCAIARTLPFMDDVEPVREVRSMLLDLIHQAEDFIYIENQFACRQEIAEALNRRMKECDNLNVLVVSSYRPKGTFECETYWAGRIDFKQILERDLPPGRVRMTCSMARSEQGKVGHKRIHSKVMTIDDRYLVIGSSNLSNRSMTIDTECDLILAADNDNLRKQIELVRNDLIAEHCGKSVMEVADILEEEEPINRLMQSERASVYHLKPIQDDVFTDKSWQSVFTPLSDPEEPLCPPLPAMNGKKISVPNPRKKTIVLTLVASCIALVIGGVALAGSLSPWFSVDSVRSLLENSRGTEWALLSVVALYAIGGVLFFPVTMLSLGVAAVFGPVWGPVYGMVGALVSAALLFYAGKVMGDMGVRKLGGHKVQRIDEKFSRSGVVGVAALRLLPIAPYSLVNLIAGISSIRLSVFLWGTFLGMAPPMIAKGLVGDSLAKIFLDPSAETIIYLLCGIVVWVGVVAASQYLAKQWQNRKEFRKQYEQNWQQRKQEDHDAQTCQL